MAFAVVAVTVVAFAVVAVTFAMGKGGDRQQKTNDQN
jgi:hypothetical protein